MVLMICNLGGLPCLKMILERITPSHLDLFNITKSFQQMLIFWRVFLYDLTDAGSCREMQNVVTLSKLYINFVVDQTDR